MSVSTTPAGFTAVGRDEMVAVEGGVLPILGRIFVRVAAKAIIYAADKIYEKLK
jgi:hypothetical protein